MNRIMWILLGSLCLIVLCSGGRKIKKNPALTVTPPQLRLFVDQHTDPYTIKVAYTLNVPAGFIPSCARLVYQPYFQAVGHRLSLTPLVISGRKNLRREKRLEALTGYQALPPDAMHLVSDGDAMKIKLTQTVPFQVWMVQSKLRADVRLEACDRESHIEVLTIAEGVVWFPQGPGPALVKYVRDTADLQKVAEFSFSYPAGQYIFDHRYAGNARQMQRMMLLIDSLQNDTTMHLEKITITGSASPSGKPDYNYWLAGQRAIHMQQRLVERRHLSPALVVLHNAGENWGELQRLVQQSEISGKETVLSTIDSGVPENERENKLHALPQYGFIKLHIFPELQNAVCRFHYTRREEVVRVVPL